MTVLTIAITATVAFAAGWCARGEFHNLIRDIAFRILASDTSKAEILKRVARLEGKKGDPS